MFWTNIHPCLPSSHSLAGLEGVAVAAFDILVDWIIEFNISYILLAVVDILVTRIIEHSDIISFVQTSLLVSDS